MVQGGVQKIRRRTGCWNSVQRPGGRVPVPSCEDTSASGAGEQVHVASVAAETPKEQHISTVASRGQSKSSDMVL